MPASPSRSTRTPSTVTVPASAGPGPAIRFSSVDLPLPDGPRIATASPGRDGQRHVVQRGRAVVVPAAHVAQLDHRRGHGGLLRSVSWPVNARSDRGRARVARASHLRYRAGMSRLSVILCGVAPAVECHRPDAAGPRGGENEPVMDVRRRWPAAGAVGRTLPTPARAAAAARIAARLGVRRAAGAGPRDRRRRLRRRRRRHRRDPRIALGVEPVHPAAASRARPCLADRAGPTLAGRSCSSRCPWRSAAATRSPCCGSCSAAPLVDRRRTRRAAADLLRLRHRRLQRRRRTARTGSPTLAEPAGRRSS